MLRCAPNPEPARADASCVPCLCPSPAAPARRRRGADATVELMNDTIANKQNNQLTTYYGRVDEAVEGRRREGECVASRVPSHTARPVFCLLPFKTPLPLSCPMCSVPFPLSLCGVFHCLWYRLKRHVPCSAPKQPWDIITYG